MDLRLSNAPVTEAERAAVDAVLGEPVSGWDGGARREPGLRTSSARRDRRHLLLPALHAVQDRAGWIGRGALEYVCARLGVAPAEVYGVATFYRLLSVEPQPPTVAYVCDDIACRMEGGLDTVRDLQRISGQGMGESDRTWTWRTTSCLGQCDRAPAALIRRSGPRPVDMTLAPASAAAVIASCERESAPARDGTRPSLDAYRDSGGFAGLERAVAIGPDAVLREVLASRLVGRGGAAFPVAAKWRAVAAAEKPRYLVCNADESEPGAFKDRMLMEERPFEVVEGMAIAAHAIGADRAYLYVRGEYPLALARMRSAIDDARGAGVLDRIEVEIRRGAGAYICGEETALLNSIEGRRGEPRVKPPYPVTHGLFGRPTVVNNVETLACVPDIVLHGGAAFASTGTAGSTGTKLFSVSGRVRRPGVYEVPFGETVRGLIALAGGVRNDRALRAVLIGGAAGAFLRPEEIDVPLTFEGLPAVGAALGSGVVMVFDDTVDLADIVLRIAAFFRDESCGQCVPCRIGTVRQEEALRRHLGARPTTGGEAVLIGDVARVMRDASICGLGQSASTAVESALAKLDLRREAP